MIIPKQTSLAVKRSVNLPFNNDAIQTWSIIKSFKDGTICSRKQIMKAQKSIELMEDHLGEDPFPLFHTIADGMYSREMHAPKGHLIVGKIHRFEHLVKLEKGRLIVADEYGIKQLEAPMTFVSKPGIKRIAIVIEDLVWTDIHKTTKTTIEEIEEEIFVESYEKYDQEINIVREH